ncbi:aldo/keto reductase [Lachnospiraceae bacterium 38-14]|uniref:aldo/keto reductase n=1 Tax=Roseburia sp. 1XD42-69 TaxID=2320088 RepID=UPI00211037AC|nr:aldo/keto reductase [Roseburia sp. 1XD42-69]
MDQKQLQKMVDLFLEKGFTYFDTSYVYHSENAIREALLMRYDRDSYTLASKLPAFIIQQEKQVETIFEEQRNKCGVQFFDYYLYNLNKILYNGVDGKGGTMKRFHMFERMQNWKAAGKIHHIGFSFHDDAETLDEILTDHPEVEFAQIAFNYYDYESPFLQAKKCYDVIQKHRCQMVVMEPVKGGMRASVPEKTGAEMKKMHPELSEASWAIRFAADLNYIKGQLAKNHYTVGDKLPEEKVILADGTDVTEQVVKAEKWLIEHEF